MDEQGFESTRLPDKAVLSQDLLFCTLDVVTSMKGVKMTATSRKVYRLGGKSFGIIFGYDINMKLEAKNG